MPDSPKTQLNNSGGIATRKYAPGQSPLEKPNDGSLDLVMFGNGLEAIEEALLYRNISKIIQYEIARYFEENPVGLFYGYPIEDGIRNSQFTSLLRLVWRSTNIPPFTRPGIKEVTLQIPEPSRFSLDWRRIKNAMGGRDGMTMGRWKAWRQIEVSYGRSQIMCWGGSKQEALSNYDSIASLAHPSSVKPIEGSLRLTEAQRDFNRNWTDLDNQKQAKGIKMYPYGFHFLNNVRIKDLLKQQERDWNRGRINLKGYNEIKSGWFKLTTDEPPKDFEDRIKRLVIGTIGDN